MSAPQKKTYAKGLLNSPRGMLLLSQALYYAIDVMSAEEFPETSNIQDMEILREEIFTFPFIDPKDPAYQEALAELSRMREEKKRE